MKYVVIAFCCLGIGAVAVSQEKLPPKWQLTTRQIETSEVIGSIGIPLGTCATIDATIMRPEPGKGDSRYLMRVTHVVRPLAEPAIIHFSAAQFATRNVKLATNSFELFKLQTGQDASSLSNRQIEQMETTYVDRRVTLIAYETGEFRGIPTRLPRSVGVWQGSAFGFNSELVVLDQLHSSK